MSAPGNRPVTPGLHIRQLSLVTDRPIGAEHGQVLGERFAAQLDVAIRQARGDVHMDIAELVVQAGGEQLRDGRALSRLAATVARCILDRVPD